MELYEHGNSKISWTVSTYDLLCCLNIINQVFRLKVFRKLKFCLQGFSFPSKSNVAVNSTSAHPPPGNPWAHLFRFSDLGRGICAPWGIPGNLIHKVKRQSKARAIKMRILFLRDGGFCGKRYGFHVTVACPQRTRQACWDFIEVSFLILESFPLLYRSNCMSYFELFWASFGVVLEYSANGSSFIDTLHIYCWKFLIKNGRNLFAIST